MKKKNIILTSIALFVFASLSNAQTKWSNPKSSTENLIHGRYWGEQNKENFNRLPAKAKDLVRDKVWSLSKESAGLSLVFKTNAKNIKIKYKVTGGHSMPHMPATGVSGVDLYAQQESGAPLWCKGDFSFGDTIRYDYQNLEAENASSKEQVFQLFLPLYNSVSFLEVGVGQNDTFQFIANSNEKSIVVYGTSIAQGACASRPGMAWTNILTRTTNQPIINLGFSGNGQLEPELFELMGEINTKLYIIDCMPNMTKERTELIYDRTIAGVRQLRKHNQAPILLVEHDGYMGFHMNPKLKSYYVNTNIELRKAYEELISEGLTDIYYLSHKELGLSPDSQVDGTHASDVGMQEYAKAYRLKIQEIFNSSK